MNYSINDTLTLLIDDDYGYGYDYDYEIPNKNDNSLFIMLTYIFGLYHLSMYIINTYNKFSYDDINNRLYECKVIFRILNENYDMFDKDNVENMNTSQLLEDSLDFFRKQEENSKCETNNEESQLNSDVEEENINNIEFKKVIEGAKTLISMGKNWQFTQ